MGNLLSKRDLEQHTIPLGIYKQGCVYDLKLLRKQILDKKLAPIFAGTEEAAEGLEECPICFLYYPGGLNRSKCCKKGICTECFIQIKKPTGGTLVCPFCNQDHYQVIYTGPLSKEEVEKDEAEDKRVKEIQDKMRLEEIERDRQREKERALRKSQGNVSGESSGGSSSSGGGGGGGSSASGSSASGSNTSVPTKIAPKAAANTSAGGSSSVGGAEQASSFPRRPQRDRSWDAADTPSFFGSYPLSSGQSESPLSDADLEDLMLMEAIRLSLAEQQPSNALPPVTQAEVYAGTPSSVAGNAGSSGSSSSSSSSSSSNGASGASAPVAIDIKDKREESPVSSPRSSGDLSSCSFSSLSSFSSPPNPRASHSHPSATTSTATNVTIAEEGDDDDTDDLSSLKERSEKRAPTSSIAIVRTSVGAPSSSSSTASSITTTTNLTPTSSNNEFFATLRRGSPSRQDTVGFAIAPALSTSPPPQPASLTLAQLKDAASASASASASTHTTPILSYTSSPKTSPQHSVNSTSTSTNTTSTSTNTSSPHSVKNHAPSTPLPTVSSVNSTPSTLVTKDGEAEKSGNISTLDLDNDDLM